MTDIIDLSLLKESRSLLTDLLARRGLNYFMARDGNRLFALEKEKVELVVKSCVAKLARKGHAVHPRAVEECRKQVRRELIRRLTEAMLKVGC